MSSTKVSRLFMAATVVASGPALYASYDVRTSPFFAAFLLIWSLAPIAVPYLILFFGRHLAAWGWNLAVLAYGYFGLITVLQSESSTASIDFLWIPVWNMVIFGPLGALIGVLVALSVSRDHPPAR
jgi:hypothetical protein